MGYHVHAKPKVRFKKGQEEAALAAIKGLKGKETVMDSYGPHFYWVLPEDFLAATSLQQALDVWRWHTILDAEDYATCIHSFLGEKAGDDDILFTALAPFIEAGSEIEWKGEDGDRWRYIFNGDKMKVIRGKFLWDE